MIMFVLALGAGGAVFAVSLLLYRMVFYKKQMLKEQLESIRRLGKDTGELEEKEAKRDRKEKGRFRLGAISFSYRQSLIRAGIAMSAEAMIFLWIAEAIIIPILLYAWSGNVFLALAGIAIGTASPYIVINQMKKRMTEKFEKQLCTALIMIGSSLKSGFSFQQALKRVGEDMPEPIAGEFRQATAEMEYGSGTESALAGISKRWDSREVQLLNTALKLQQKTGGSLAEIVDVVVEIIRTRVKLRRMVSSLSAQGKISGMVVGGMPVFMVIALSAIDGIYRQTIFYTLPGNLVLLAVGIIETIGFIFIYRIVNIKL